MAEPIELKGMIPPVITPLAHDGAVDEAAVARLTDFQLRSGASAIFIMGSSGEGPWLDTSQREALLRASVRAIDGRVPLLAGVMEPVAARVCERLPQLAGAGVDVAVVTTPWYFQADEATQRAHFDEIAAASPLPLMLYNIPQMTHNPLTPATAAQALQHEAFIGIKDSGGDEKVFQGMLALRERFPRFRVMQGSEPRSAWAMRAGADGLVPGIGNLIPGVMGRIAANPEDEAAQHLANELGGIRAHGYFLPCMKYAMALCGFGSGRCISRPDMLGPAAKEAIRSLIARLAPEALACAPPERGG